MIRSANTLMAVGGQRWADGQYPACMYALRNGRTGQEECSGGWRL